MRPVFRLLFPLFLFPASWLWGQQLKPDYLHTAWIRNIGPGAMSGRITAIVCDPERPEVIYAGAASGGVWRSVSGGTHWEPIFDSAPTQSIGAIAINPKNPDEIWVGTGEGNPRNSQNFGAGIFKSIDGGKKWMQMGLEKTRTIHRIIVHRDNPDIVFAASLGSASGPNEDRGVFKSTDGGRTWRKVLYVNDLTGCADLVADPSNPNKLFAAMWEYRRWPWFFNSGGKGSGLYVSYDGGETWTRRTDKDGLPEGDLGRIGLAVAPSNPAVVYALVEAKENALYKSTDGGRHWQKMADKSMGDRPFYYSEIYVNPKNEHMIYSVHSQITRSLDGGKSFERFVGFWDIHPDHHAFWIHPDDPDYMIDGNDGGLNITHDGGRTWRYAENIPVGQFYHLNLDNERPYNIYGGLQDNGSWIGPSSVWKNGGLRNAEWQEILFGDGFDAMPRRDDSRYAFAMSQGGELNYIDRQTGDSRYIKPLHPSGVELRFNWNAALAQDPFHAHGLFFGSQFLHYSPDLGNHWQILSPDLTSGDTSKLHQDRSGGLTLDATNAENYCTIIAISPSPVQEGVIWVGTDDGRLQLTRDGGKTWENLAGRLPDCPENGWIPQIEVSTKNAGEAFVVVNNYRQNDWQPYLYHTTDFGKKWRRLANAKNVGSFCLSVVQDPEVPNLLFLGTDQGLYISIDYGENWTQMPHDEEGGFPCVPVQDMKIHPRDGDLVLATFGRGIWVWDDIRPLREIARSNGAALQQAFKVFPPQDAVMAAWRSFNGQRFGADALYAGDNKGGGARFTVWVKPDEVAASKEKKKKKNREEADKKDKSAGGGKAGDDNRPDKAIVMIQSMNGDTLRRFKTDIDTCFNYVYWGFDTKGVRFPSNNTPGPDQLEPGGGPAVLPGTYKVTMIWGDFRDSTTINVLGDERLGITMEQHRAQQDATRDLYKQVERATKAYDRLKEAEKTIKLVEDQLANTPDSTKKEVMKLGKTLRDSIGVLKDAFFTQKEGKGIQRNPENLNARYWKAMGYLQPGLEVPGANAQIAIDEAKAETDKLVGRVNALFDGPWKEYRAKVERLQYALFKDFDRL